jgi:hypothetical protein
MSPFNRKVTACHSLVEVIPGAHGHEGTEEIGGNPAVI